LLALQWLEIYTKSELWAGLVNITATILFGTLSYLSSLDLENGHTGKLATQLYSAAAVAGIASAIYTRLIMFGVLTKLQDRVVAVRKMKSNTILESDADDHETHGLVQQWGSYNLYRGILPLVSAVVGIGACVAYIERE
jgi:hypothetical protein